MQKLRILNKREVRDIYKILKKQFDCDLDLNYVFMLNDKDKLYISNKEIFDLDIDKLKINSMGIYFGYFKDHRIRLSIEGTQIVGPKAKKNVLELHDNEVRIWMRGFDLFKELEHKDFVIVKNKNDYLGCGKPIEGKVLNYVPKIRRLMSSD